MMEISDWNERYRSDAGAEGLNAPATPLLVETVERLARHRHPKTATAPLQALDLACGAGRNALWLAAHGWKVTAVDGAPAAVAILQDRAAQCGLNVDARVADLVKGEYPIDLGTWDLIAILYYLQRDLFAPAKRGLAPGGVLIAIVHISEPGEESTAHRLRPGELGSYFEGWEVLHQYEGKPRDIAHQRAVAEVVVRRSETSITS